MKNTTNMVYNKELEILKYVQKDKYDKTIKHEIEYYSKDKKQSGDIKWYQELKNKINKKISRKGFEKI